MCKNRAGNYSRIIGLILISLLMIACEVTIESPTATTFYEGQEIHFDVEYNGVGTVLWRSEYTVPGDPSGTVYAISNSEFKDGVTGVGKGYPWEFMKSNLPVGVHKITIYKNEDTAKITITILPFCDNPELNCSCMNDDNCNVGICDSDKKECVTATADNGTSCDDGFTCTENDQCSDGICIGQNSCLGNGECTEFGCQYSGDCQTNFDCEYLISECHEAYCNTISNECISVLKNGFCYLDGLCRNDGDIKENEQCVNCNSSDPDSWSPMSFGTCDDGNACTIDDSCINGICISYDSLDCDDNNSCTIDSCDPEMGCINENETDGQSCDIGNNLECVIGSCSSGECKKEIKDGYCLINGECILANTYSSDGCSYCNPEYNQFWYWDESTEGQICTSNSSVPDCGESVCKRGTCTFEINENTCLINGECVPDGGTTSDTCWQCDVESGAYTGNFVGGINCDVNADFDLLVSHDDVFKNPVALSTKYVDYRKEVPEMLWLNPYDKAFFISKGGRPVVVTCELWNQEYSVAVRSYPGLREVFREKVWDTTYSNDSDPNPICPIDAIDLNDDGFKEIIVGAPQAASDIQGNIAVFELGETFLKKISRDELKLGLSDFRMLRVGKWNGYRYLVAWNNNQLQAYNIMYDENGELSGTDSSVWHISNSNSNVYMKASIIDGTVVVVENENLLNTLIKSINIQTGEEISSYRKEFFLSEAAEVCDGSVYIAKKILLSVWPLKVGSEFYSFNPETDVDLNLIGSKQYLVKRIFCQKNVDWLRLPRTIEEETTGKVEDTIIEYDTDEYDYKKYTKKNAQYAINNWGDRHIGEVEFDLSGGASVTISQPISVDHLIISGDGTLTIATENQNFQNITISGGSLVTASDYKVGISKNLLIETADVDVSSASFSFNGSSKSSIVKMDGGDLQIGTLKVDKSDTFFRVEVDKSLNSFTVYSIDSITGILEIGKSTDFIITASNGVVNGDGTLIVRSPVFTTPNISFGNVNLNIFGESKEEPTIVNVAGEISVAGDFRIIHGYLPECSLKADFNLTDRVQPIIEFTDVTIGNVSGALSSEPLFYIHSDSESELANTSLRVKDFIIENIDDSTNLWINTNITDTRNWSIRDIIKNGIEIISIDLYNENQKLEHLENSSFYTEMIGYHKVGFIDGTNCDMWPKQVSFNELDTKDVTHRLESLGGSVGTNVKRKLTDYLKKANTDEALIIGSKYGLTLETASVEFLLSNEVSVDNINASKGERDVVIAFDRSTNVGYVLSPEFICTEDDLNKGLCDFLSKNKPIIGIAGNIKSIGATGEGIDDSTQILTRTYDNRREFHKITDRPFADLVTDMKVDTVVLAAPTVSVASKKLRLGLNTIIIADTVKGKKNGTTDVTTIEVNWVGHGSDVEGIEYHDINSNENDSFESLMKIMAYDPKTPPVCLVAANKVSGIKAVKVSNRSNYFFNYALSQVKNISTGGNIYYTTKSEWDETGNVVDNVWSFYDWIEGKLTSDFWYEKEIYTGANENINMEITSFYNVESVEEDEDNDTDVIRWVLNLPSFHGELEGGLSAIITDSEYTFAKGSSSDEHMAPAYKRGSTYIDKSEEVLEALFYKMYSDVEKMNSGLLDPFGNTYSVLKICKKLPDGQLDCEPIIRSESSVDVERYCIGVCTEDYRDGFPYYYGVSDSAISKVVCINDFCPRDYCDPARTTRTKFYKKELDMCKALKGNNNAYYFLICSDDVNYLDENGNRTLDNEYGLLCYDTESCPELDQKVCPDFPGFSGGQPNIGDSTFLTYSNLGLIYEPIKVDVELTKNSLIMVLLANKESIKTTIKKQLKEWESVVNSKNKFPISPNGPKENGSVSSELTKNLQFALSNGEMFKLYSQLGQRADKMRSQYVNHGEGWDMAYELISSSPYYSSGSLEGLALLKYGLRTYYTMNVYPSLASLQSTTSHKVDSIPYSLVLDIDAKYNYDPDLQGDIRANSIGMPYGYVARSWNQISNFKIQNQLSDEEFNTDEVESSYSGDSSYLNGYTKIKEPASFATYLQRWYKVQDTINVLLTTLREKREDKIYIEALKDRLKFIKDVLQRYSEQQINASTNQIVDSQMFIKSLNILTNDLISKSNDLEDRKDKFIDKMTTIFDDLDNQCSSGSYERQQLEDKITNYANGANTVADKVHDFAEFFKNYGNVSGNFGKFINSVSSFSSAISKPLSVVAGYFKLLSILDFWGGVSCTDVDRKIIEGMQAEFENGVNDINSMLTIIGAINELVALNVMYAEMGINYHEENIEILKEFQYNLAGFSAFVNEDWTTNDYYNRYGLPRTCQGMRLAVDSAQREMYSTTQLLNTSLGSGYTPSYFMMPPAYSHVSSGVPQFKTYDSYGFYVSLWDDLANFKLEDYDSDFISGIGDTYKAGQDSEFRDIVNNKRIETDDEYGMKTTPIQNEIKDLNNKYTKDIENRISYWNFERRNTQLDEYAYIVRSLKRVPCSYEEEDTGEKQTICDDDENCHEENITVKQPRYCDRGVDIDPVNGEEFADSADVFLTTGVAKFRVTPQDLANSGYYNSVKGIIHTSDPNDVNPEVDLAPPIVYEVRFRVYYADYWCEYKATGEQINCCTVDNLDGYPQSLEYTPSKCPNNFKEGNFAFYGSGFDDRNNVYEGNLFIINAVPQTLKPKAVCIDPETAIVKKDNDEITMNVCTRSMYSLPEWYEIQHESAISDTNTEIVNEYSENYPGQISLQEITESTIRGVPALGTWYLIYDKDRANYFATSLYSGNNEFGLSIPQDDLYSNLSQGAMNLDTPYSFYKDRYLDETNPKGRFEETMDMDKISQIDVIFVVSKTPSPVPYWKEAD